MQLRELEEYGVIERNVYAEVPPKVEYSTSQAFQSLKPIIDAMWHWGTGFLSRLPQEEVAETALDRS